MATYNRNKYKIQEVISGGEIGGLLTPDNPMYSVHLDGTPMAKANGEVNHRGAAITVRNGSEDQDPVEGFEDIGITTGVGIELEDDMEWVVQEIPAGFSRARIVLRYPNGLYRYSSKGKYQSWDMRYDIAISTDDSTWVTVVSIWSSARSSNSFDRVHYVINPNLITGSDDSFYVRCRRTRGPGNDREVGTLQWFAYVALQTSEQSYPNTAYSSVEFDAAQFGGALPVRGYRFRGIRCQVPNIYNPTEYDPQTGEVISWPSYDQDTWDGVFKTDHCDDPIWIAYTIMVNEVWGAGETVDSDSIDIYSLFEASKYNVEQIDNGEDPLHPRFIWNGRISSLSNMRSMVDGILATCMAATYEEEGIVRVFQDRPDLPVGLLIRGNVIDGEMQFSSAPLSSRVTASEVTYNDRRYNFEPTVEQVEGDESMVNAYGYRTQNIMLNGVVDRAQAIRAGRWTIENSLTSAQSLTLAVGWENWHLGIGDICYVVDETLHVDAIQARLEQIDGDTITLRNPLPRSFTNERMIVSTDTGLVEVTATGLEGEFSFTVSDDTGLNVLDAFVIYDGDLFLYRINGYSYNEAEKTLNLGLYDPTKYGRIETGEPSDPAFPPPSDQAPFAVRNLTVFGNISEGVPSLHVNWRAPVSQDDPDFDDETISSYSITVDGLDGTRDEIISDTSITFENVPFGEFIVTVTAYTALGVPSPDSTVEYDFNPAGSSELLPPVAINGGFDNKDLNLSWSDNPNNATHPTLSVDAFILNFGDDATLGSRTEIVPIETEELEDIYRFQYNYDMNTQDHDSPTRTIFVSVAVQDNMGLVSPVVESDFTNPAPLAPIMNAFGNFNQVSLSLSPDASLGGNWEEDADGFLFEVDGVVFDANRSPVFLFDAEEGVTYNVRAAVYDLFGKDEVNWCPMQQVSPIDAPDAPTIPDFAREEYEFINLEWEINPDNGSISWSDHTVARLVWSNVNEDYDRTEQAVSAGSLAYDASNPYVVYNYEDNLILLAPFDGWFDLADFLHGQVGLSDGVYEWLDGGINKLAVNAISAKHIQADAVLANNIKADEKIIIGASKTAPNTIILDGTAQADTDPTLWIGGNVDDGGAANYAVLRNGTVFSRNDLQVSGNATIAGQTTLQDNTTVGNSETHVLQSGSFGGEGAGWQLRGDGQMVLRSSASGDRLEINGDRIDVYEGDTLRVRIGNLD
ncbi:phage tail protein [Vibrio astriarenae]|uniref:phage tail protein n=1 Tax=Vibrio astriarenae TaxID=1481923 RepID=UPI003734CBEC